YIFGHNNASPNTNNFVELEANTAIFKAHPTSRLSSLATTNDDYFKKCAPVVTCTPDDKYRTYNGSCNNLQNPSWGAALTPFYRLIKPSSM
ncbi:peroxidase-like, partial [Aphis craccivora]